MAAVELRIVTPVDDVSPPPADADAPLATPAKSKAPKEYQAAASPHLSSPADLHKSMATSSPDNDGPCSLIPLRHPCSPSPSTSAHRRHPIALLADSIFGHHPWYRLAGGPSFSTPDEISTESTPYGIPYAATPSDAAPRHHPCYPLALRPSINPSPQLRHSTPYDRPAIGSSNVHHSFNPRPSMDVDSNGRALLPHQILASAFCAPDAHNEEDARLAEHRWKRMVSDLHSTGKFRNSIAVYFVSTNMSETAKQVSIAMTLLISELSHPPWKGKSFNFNENPYLFYIEGNSILDKAKFLRDYFEGSLSQDFLDYEMVFKQILKVAEDAKLKQDDMIKRVFLFTDCSFQYSSYYRAKVHDVGLEDSWKREYGMLSSMFSRAGYAMPKIVFCNLHQRFTDNPWACSDTEEVRRMPYRIRQMLLQMFDDLVDVCQVQRMPNGVTQMVGGMSDDLLELFLEKDAVLTKNDFVEAC